jgi:hypothetical protein
VDEQIRTTTKEIINKYRKEARITYIESPYGYIDDTFFDNKVWTELEIEFTKLLAQALQAQREELLDTIESVMIDKDFLFNGPIVPPWYGTKHGTQERGELVAAKRFQEQLLFLINQLRQQQRKRVDENSI